MLALAPPEIIWRSYMIGRDLCFEVSFNADQPRIAIGFNALFFRGTIEIQLRHANTAWPAASVAVGPKVTSRWRRLLKSLKAEGDARRAIVQVRAMTRAIEGTVTAIELAHGTPIALPPPRPPSPFFE